MKLERRCYWCEKNIFSVKTQNCDKSISKKHEWKVFEVIEDDDNIDNLPKRQNVIYAK
jgi:hypothetical protein